MSLVAKGVGLSVLAWIAAASLGAKPTDTSPCFPASDASAGMLARYQFVDTATDKLQTAWRQSLGLPVIAVSQITLVSDSTVCRRGVTAFNSILADDSLAPSVSVNVVRYGSTRYIIGDPAHVVGEWKHEPVVDTAFVEIATAGR
jgi:hypothetical protein